MKLPYSEGSVFLVPLRGSGYARGVVARSGPQGKVLFGYFFGPRLRSTEDADMNGLHPSEAVLCLRFGDLGILRKEWPIVGSVADWNRENWQMPRFVRRDPLGRLKPRVVEYSDNDPNVVLAEWVVECEPDLPTNSLSGYEAVSIKLDNLLGSDSHE
jgi:hypothetical protein